jgi:uncharacterized membrane protein
MANDKNPELNHEPNKAQAPDDVMPEPETENQVQPDVEPETISVENVGEEREPSPAERMTDSAREQASAAAEAFRRGEFMRDVAVDADANSDDRLIALLSYITQILIPGIMPILVLLSESSKNRPFQRYHAVQSLALVVLFALIALVVSIATVILGLIPIIGWLIGVVVLCLSPIAVLMAYIALVYYGYQAYQGKRFAIPGLTNFLREQGWL